MGQTEYLHDKGTDRLIADVLAYDPTKVNPAEADEVPEAFDEFTGPCETRPAAKAKSEPFDWVKDHVDMSYRIGYRAALLDCMDFVINSTLPAAVRRQLIEKFAAMNPPAGTTRKG